MSRAEVFSSRRRSSFGIGATLVALILSILLPILAAEVFIYSKRFEKRVQEEHNTNLEVARVFGKMFEALIHDILRQESAIGVFIGRSVSPTSAEARRILEDSSKDFDFILDFNWVDPEGRVLASSNPDFIGVETADRSFFRDLISGSDWVVSDLIQSKRTGESIFVIGRAIRDEGGIFLGFVMARIVPDRLDPVLAFERPGGATTCLLDTRGELVYSYPRLIPAGEEPHRSGDLLLSGKMERPALPFVQEGRIVAGAPIPSIGWLATASREKDEVTGPIIRDLGWNGSVLLFVMCSSFLFSLSLSRRIFKPIQRLTAYALSIARRDLIKPPDLSGPAEIRDLTRVFIEAEKTLRDSENNLKRQLLELKRTEEALRESEERHRSIFENSMDGILLSYPYGRILAANPEACRMHGYTEEEMCRVGRDGITDKNDPRLQKLVEGRARTGRYRGEVTHIRRDGTRFPCETSTVLFKDKNGLESSVVIIRDVTERRLAEEAQRRAKDELELRVRERTAELERSNKELQDFVFIASHDLKEPLRKIQVFGDLVVTYSGASIDQKGLDHLCRIHDAAERMQRLLESLLAYSRVTTSAKPFSRADLVEAARNAVSNLEILLKQTGGLVEIGDLPILLGDSAQLVQLFQNLLGNALKFHRKGEKPRVGIHSRFFENGGSKAGEYEIYVDDNGIGFDEKYLDKIFVPFQRLHGRDEYDGVGMGLAICRKIVERHGGVISAKSTPGKGSTFIVRLPARQDEANSRPC
jgi:PAS domain S-box-containing protein